MEVGYSPLYVYYQLLISYIYIYIYICVCVCVCVCVYIYIYIYIYIYHIAGYIRGGKFSRMHNAVTFRGQNFG